MDFGSNPFWVWELDKFNEQIAKRIWTSIGKVLEIKKFDNIRSCILGYVIFWLINREGSMILRQRWQNESRNKVCSTWRNQTISAPSKKQQQIKNLIEYLVPTSQTKMSASTHIQSLNYSNTSSLTQPPSHHILPNNPVQQATPSNNPTTPSQYFSAFQDYTSSPSIFLHKSSIAMLEFLYHYEIEPHTKAITEHGTVQMCEYFVKNPPKESSLSRISSVPTTPSGVVNPYLKIMPLKRHVDDEEEHDNQKKIKLNLEIHRERKQARVLRDRNSGLYNGRGRGRSYHQIGSIHIKEF